MPAFVSYLCRLMRSPSQLVSWVKHTPKATGRRICPRFNPEIAYKPCRSLILAKLFSFSEEEFFYGHFEGQCIGVTRHGKPYVKLVRQRFGVTRHGKSLIYTVSIEDPHYVSWPTYRLSYRSATICNLFSHVKMRHVAQLRYHKHTCRTSKGIKYEIQQLTPSRTLYDARVK